MSTITRNATNRNTTNRNTTNTSNNQTRKLRNNTILRNKAIISNYEKNIIELNPQQLPSTEFIDYTKNLYEPFVIEKEEKRSKREKKGEKRRKKR